MIIHESNKTFDKNVIYFFLLLLTINQHVFLHSIFFLYTNWILFLIFITRNPNGDGIILFDFVNFVNVLGILYL